MKKKPVRLYNVLFPLWALYLLPLIAPALWLILLPANLLVDSLVLVLGARALKLRREDGEANPLFRLWKKHILPVWLFGFLSDFAGGGLTLGLASLLDSVVPELSTFLFPGTTLISIPGVLAAGALIYALNRFVTFRKSGLTPAEAHRLCLTLAVFTAPYTMLLPLYG